MAKKLDTFNKEQRQTDKDLKREDVLQALRRLRDVGEKLPTVDAAAVVREGRDLPTQGTR